jgi:hypothetical protein|tara:strand:+ start:685 stop:1374 length:690 start_codon:yes stop_codon:yes gene_type:complete
MSDEVCYLCQREVRTYMTFGKAKCQDCIEKSKTGIPGNSGMIYHADHSHQFGMLFVTDKIVLERVPKSHPTFVKWYMDHYPGSKGIVGRQMNYLIHHDELPIGIISGASPPRNYKKFRKFFSVDDDLGYLNNNVYRIVHKPDDKNIGTKVLKIFRLRVRQDYRERYGDDLLGLVTFVEPPRTGAIYKADNWIYLGKTQGITVRRRGDDWMEKQYMEGIKKHIFAYRYKC